MNWMDQYDHLQRHFESFDPANIYWTILICIWVGYLFELYLCLRQRKIYVDSIKKVPKVLEDTISLEDFESSRLDGMEKNNLTMYSNLTRMVKLMVLLHFKVLYYGWLLTGSMFPWTLFWPSSWNTEIGRSIIFINLYMTFSALVDLPLSIYTERNKQPNKFNLKVFLFTKVVELVLQKFIFCPLMGALVVKIVQAGGPYFFIWLAVFFFMMEMFFITIYPIVIAPLFENHKSQLKEGSLKTRLVAFASLLNFSPAEIYVVKSAGNQFGSQFERLYSKERITLSEDHFKRSSEDPYEKYYSDLEVEALVLLFLGSWKLNHKYKNRFISEIKSFLGFALIALFYQNPALFQAFGFPVFGQETPIILGLVIDKQFLDPIYNDGLRYFENGLKRLFVFQADNFVCKLGYGEHLKSVLIKFHRGNLGFPLKDPIYSAYHNSVPTLLERIAAFDQKKEKND